MVLGYGSVWLKEYGIGQLSIGRHAGEDPEGARRVPREGAQFIPAILLRRRWGPAGGTVEGGEGYGRSIDSVDRSLLCSICSIEGLQ